MLEADRSTRLLFTLAVFSDVEVPRQPHCTLPSTVSLTQDIVHVPMISQRQGFYKHLCLLTTKQSDPEELN